MSTFKIEDCVALVTGASKENGIGNEIVRALLKAGAKKVYVTSRNADQIEGIDSEFEDKVVPVELDLTDEDSIESLADKCPDVTLIVNNAGYMAGHGPLDDLEAAHRETHVNYMGPMSLVKVLEPVLEKAEAQDDFKATAIVNINSISSFINMPAGGTYSASKASEHSLTQAQRRDMPDTLVIGVYPGPVETDMTKDQDVEKAPTRVIAEAVVNALENGTEEVIPDDKAKELYDEWKNDHRQVEEKMAAMSVDDNDQENNSGKQDTKAVEDAEKDNAPKEVSPEEERSSDTQDDAQESVKAEDCDEAEAPTQSEDLIEEPPETKDAAKAEDLDDDDDELTDEPAENEENVERQETTKSEETEEPAETEQSEPKDGAETEDTGVSEEPTEVSPEASTGKAADYEHAAEVADTTKLEPLTETEEPAESEDLAKSEAAEGSADKEAEANKEAENVSDDATNTDKPVDDTKLSNNDKSDEWTEIKESPENKNEESVDADKTMNDEGLTETDAGDTNKEPAADKNEPSNNAEKLVTATKNAIDDASAAIKSAVDSISGVSPEQEASNEVARAQ